MLHRKFSALLMIFSLLWQQLAAILVLSLATPAIAATAPQLHTSFQYQPALAQVSLATTVTAADEAVSSLEYQLTYQHQVADVTEPVTEQVQGELVFDASSSAFLAQAYLGTCSSDGVCTPHQELVGGEVVVTAVAGQHTTTTSYKLWWVNGVMWVEQDGVYTTSHVVANKAYQLPGQDVVLEFDDIASGSGTLSIKPLTLDAATQAATGALSTGAYEITSNMPDGSFSYHLSLPLPESAEEDAALAIRYAETVSELPNAETAGLVLAEVNAVENTVTVTDLDHFTVFTVVDPNIGETSGGAGLAWQNPERVMANDNSAARVIFPFLALGSQQSEALLATDYSLNVPSSAVIEGIQVRVRRRVNIDLPIDARDQSLQLLKAGVATGSNLAQAGSYPSTYAYATYGGPTELWGTTWTPAEVNASDFGVSLLARRQAHILPQTVSVDHVEVTVFYNTPPTVTVIAPDGGEIWAGGSNHTIAWSAADEDGDALTVDLAYATDGTTFTDIATGLSNSGSYDWAVPLLDSTTVQIRARATDPQAATAEDLSDANFTVDSTAPEAPLFWVEEDTATVTLDWTALADAANYDIYRDGSLLSSVAAPLTNFIDSTVATGETHTYEVRAVDAAGNISVPQTAKQAVTFDFVIDDNAQASDVAGTGTTAQAGSWGAYSTNLGGYAAAVLQNAVGGDNWSLNGAAVGGESFTWTTNTNLNGWYEVYVQSICDASRGEATYDVFSGSHQVNSTPIIIDQATLDGETSCGAQAATSQLGPQWISLGQFPMVDAPAQVRLSVAAGQSYILADAVAFRFVEPVNAIQGRIFRDVNADGVFNPAERNLPGRPNLINDWIVELFDTAWTPIDQMNSGDDATFAGSVGKGQYRFVGLREGTYYVCQQPLAGWLQTRPTLSMANTVASPFDSNWNCYEVAVSGGQTVVGRRFGAFELGRITGLVFQDDNDNGTQEVPEATLSGRTVYLDTNNSGTFDGGDIATTSAATGYAFVDLVPGTYSVCQVVLNNWEHTSPTPDCYALTVATSGQVFADTNFGTRPILPPSPGAPGPAAPTPAQPPVCSATTPAHAPANLRITASGWQTVTLAWEPVFPSTHYALVFTRLSDGASYGSTNIGNVTSYTILGLSGNQQYRFEVMAVNDCAPGARASVTSDVIQGSALTSRPYGQDGQVLGAEQPVVTKTAEIESTMAEVKGASVSDSARSWLNWLKGQASSCSSFVGWWLALVFLAAASFLAAVLFRSDRWRRALMAVLLVVALVLLHRWHCSPWLWMAIATILTIIFEILVTLVGNGPQQPQAPAKLKRVAIPAVVVQPKKADDFARPVRRRRQRRPVVRFFM